MSSIIPTTIGAVTLSTNRSWEVGRDRTSDICRDIEFFVLLKDSMVSMAKKTRRKAQREAIRVRHQMDLRFTGEEEDTEIAFRPIVQQDVDPSPPTSLPSPGSPDASVETQYGVVLDMVQKLDNEMNLITLDNDKIRTVCEKLLHDNKDRDRAMCDLTGLVKRSLDHPSERLPQPDAFKPHPIICPDLIDNNGNLRATDIGITWVPRCRYILTWSQGCWTGCYGTTYATSTGHVDTISTGERSWWM